MKFASLGKAYQDGETIVRKGDPGDCIFVIQRGRAEVLLDGGSDGVDGPSPGILFGGFDL